MCVMIEKYVKMTWRGSCGDNVTFEREKLCNLIGEKMDSCLLQKGQHQTVQWSIRQLELMLEDILKSSLIGWGFWDEVYWKVHHRDEIECRSLEYKKKQYFRVFSRVRGTDSPTWKVG